MSYYDRVRESSTTQGVGPFVLAGAVVGFRPFGAVLGDGEACYYAAEAINAAGALTGDWEVGEGRFTAPATLARTRVIASSNGGAPVAFVAGNKNVWLDAPAEALGAFLTQAETDSLYLTPAEADALFVTPAEADARYLTPAQGDAAYLSQAEADALYVTPAQADAKYLTPAQADARYYTQVQSDARYMTPAQGDARYLTPAQGNAAYLAITAQAADAAKLLGSTWAAPPAIGATPNTINGTTISATSKFLAADGTAAAPSFAFTGSAGTGFARGTSASRIVFATLGVAGGALSSGGVILKATASLMWSDNANPDLGTMDCVISRDGANTIAQRNAANGQTYRIYNSYTDAATYERLSLGWLSNVIEIASEAAGAGSTGRSIRIRASSLNAAIVAVNTGGADRWQCDANGAWRAAFDNAVDIGLVANNRPRNVFIAGGLAVKTKAGALTDADFTNPADGMMAVDTTNSRLYVRVGGVWKSAALT